MTKFLISPAERPPITNLGTISALPEASGVDILWQGKEGLAGAQRKTQMDLIASVRDGRLGKELQQMGGLAYRFLILEGVPAWTSDGKLNVPHTTWNLRQQLGVELSIQSQGCFVLRSRSALETCSTCEFLYDWTMKDSHTSSLLARPGPQKNGWGQIDDRATAIHVYSGLPHVGIELASRIFDSGKKLIVCGMTREELMEIEGIGPKKADAILRALGEKETVNR